MPRKTSLQIDLRFTVSVLDTRGKESVSDSGSVIKMEITFKTHNFKVAELKLSEVRALLGATTEFREIEANATQPYVGDGEIPVVISSMPQEKFIAWAKTFGNSQALMMLNEVK